MLFFFSISVCDLFIQRKLPESQELDNTCRTLGSSCLWHHLCDRTEEPVVPLAHDRLGAIPSSLLPCHRKIHRSKQAGGGVKIVWMGITISFRETNLYFINQGLNTVYRVHIAHIK